VRTTTPTGPLTVVAGENLKPVEDATNELVILLVVGIPLLLLVVSGTTWLVTGRALRPVEEIRAQVASISEHDLHRRVPEPEARDEVSNLASTMNEMLSRLEEAYAARDAICLGRVARAANADRGPARSTRSRPRASRSGQLARDRA